MLWWSQKMLGELTFHSLKLSFQNVQYGFTCDSSISHFCMVYLIPAVCFLVPHSYTFL